MRQRGPSRLVKKARGRKRMFPEFMWLFFQAAVSECGSARQVEAG
jgi:hypothetical protein